MKLVANWKTIIGKSWAMYAAYFGLIMPEVLQLLADNVASMPYIDDNWKTVLRVGALAGVILLRPIKQTGSAAL